MLTSALVWIPAIETELVDIPGTKGAMRPGLSYACMSS